MSHMILEESMVNSRLPAQRDFGKAKVSDRDIRYFVRRVMEAVYIGSLQPSRSTEMGVTAVCQESMTRF